jgi:hypothetical protein
MSNRRKRPSEEDLASLRQRISSWRGTRTGRGLMPAEIWDSAVTLARMFGVCKIARAVGLDYKALRSKVAKAMEKPGLVKPTFVELPATVAKEGAPGQAPGALIEISAADGARMRIHLETGRGMEAAGIVTAFLRSRG